MKQQFKLQGTNRCVIAPAPELYQLQVFEGTNHKGENVTVYIHRVEKVVETDETEKDTFVIMEQEYWLKDTGQHVTEPAPDKLRLRLLVGSDDKGKKVKVYIQRIEKEI